MPGCLPRGVKLANCVPDKHRRNGHIYHAPTDEVFSVDMETYNKVCARFAPSEETGEPVEDAEGLLEETEQLEETPEQPTGEGVPSLDELKRMAADLELTIADDATAEQISAAIHDHLAGAQA